MCLYRVDFTKKGLSRKVLTGYKLFWTAGDSKLYFQFRHHNGEREVVREKWLTSDKKEVKVLWSLKKYIAGFHIYKEKSEIEKIYVGKDNHHRIVKVKYKGVLAEGTEHTQDVVVAKHMWVPRQRRGRRNKGCLRRNQRIIQ